MEYDERYQVRNQEIERYLRTLAALINDEAPEGWGWGLFLVKFGNNPIEKGGAVFWISNSEREGMIDAVKGWIEDIEKRKNVIKNLDKKF
jgi:hypothetical protein